MSESTPPNAAPATVAGTPASTTGAGVEDDPFLRLHKMSTTAGLGSGDYVAINGNAVAAVLLGVTSAFVLMGSNLLLLLPLAAIVCAIIAFRQISDSNGTQTGRGLATLGLLLAVGLGGSFAGHEAFAAVRNHADSRQIISIMREFGSDLHNERYPDAYQLFDEHFRDRVPLDRFTTVWQQYNAHPNIGKITGGDWNNLLEFATDPVTGERTASGMLVMGFEHIPGKDRVPTIFRLLQGKWWIDDMPNVFPETPQPGQAGPGGPGAAGPSAPAGPAGPPVPSNMQK